MYQMNKKPYILVTGLLFALMAIAQFTRATLQLPVQFIETQVPVWVSWIAGTVLAVLSIWAFRLLK